MNKHMPGFVPVRFKYVGIAIIAFGITLMLFDINAYLAEQPLHPKLLYWGLGALLLGAYIYWVGSRK